MARFIGAESPAEVIFTPGTTVGINIVANSLAHGGIGPGDEVWISAQEHHGNWVPWLKATQTLGAHLRIIPLLPDGHLDLARFQEGLAGGRVRWVALTWVSNVLGFENDVRAFCAAAHGAGARVLVDAAQAAAHVPMDVRALGCDFLAFSGHKMYGPMGIGVLWGRAELLAQMEPFILGGEMIGRVEEQAATWAEPPYRFEGGTPNVMVELVLAFDGLVQHTDREADNPNLMWKGHELAVLDHEKVFGYLNLAKGEARPWRSFFQTKPFTRHVLASAVRRMMTADFGRVLWENILELELGGGSDEFQKTAESAFPAAKVDLVRIRAYLSSLVTDAGDFFDYLKASLQP